MRYVPTLATALLCCTVSACGAHANVEGSGTAQSSAIVGGSATNGYPAVGLLANFAPGDNSANECTATYIGGNRVLTAAHCVLALNSAGTEQPALASPSNVIWYAGSSVNQEINRSQEYYATGLVVAGNNFPFQQFLNNEQNGVYNYDDMAIVYLSAQPNVQAMAVSTTAITDADLGKQLTMVGYGTTGKYDDQTTAGDKRVVSTPITGYNDVYIQAGTANAGTCSGDSGGPAILNNQIVGVTQMGNTDNNGNCVGGDIFTRTDAWHSFIQNF